MTKSLVRTYFFAGFFHGEMHYWPDNLPGCVRATLSRIIESLEIALRTAFLSWNVPAFPSAFLPAEITFPFFYCLLETLRVRQVPNISRKTFENEETTRE